MGSPPVGSGPERGIERILGPHRPRLKAAFGVRSDTGVTSAPRWGIPAGGLERTRDGATERPIPGGTMKRPSMFWIAVCAVTLTAVALACGPAARTSGGTPQAAEAAAPDAAGQTAPAEVIV